MNTKHLFLALFFLICTHINNAFFCSMKLYDLAYKVQEISIDNLRVAGGEDIVGILSAYGNKRFSVADGSGDVHLKKDVEENLLLQFRHTTDTYKTSWRNVYFFKKESIKKIGTIIVRLRDNQETKQALLALASLCIKWPLEKNKNEAFLIKKEIEWYLMLLGVLKEMKNAVHSYTVTSEKGISFIEKKLDNQALITLLSYIFSTCYYQD